MTNQQQAQSIGNILLNLADIYEANTGERKQQILTIARALSDWSEPGFNVEEWILESQRTS